MQIKVTFDNLGEMKEFCQTVFGGPEGKELPEPKEPERAQRQLPTAEQTRTVTPTSVPVQEQTIQTTVPASVPVSVAHPTPAPAPVPTSVQSYTLDDLSRAAITLLDAGHQQTELQQLLAQFGVAALPMLPESQYGAFATALRGLGAKI